MECINYFLLNFTVTATVLCTNSCPKTRDICILVLKCEHKADSNAENWPEEHFTTVLLETRIGRRATS